MPRDPRSPAPAAGGFGVPARMAAALATGSAGGWAATAAGMPLPWMLGAMLATAAAAVIGVPVAIPRPVRALFIMVLGVMLGSAFTPAMMARSGMFAASLTAMLVYVALAGAFGVLFFHRLAGYDRTTSYFAGMPGGLSEMVIVGEAMGGDPRAISLIHGARVMLVVLALPFALQLVLGYDAAARPAPGQPIAVVPAADLAILAMCGGLGLALARILGLPAAPMVGPMLLSALVHLTGWTKLAPPGELVAAAQVVVGSAVGCRFAGTAAATIARTAGWAAGGTAILLATALLVASAVHRVTGLEITALTLAYAPGGLAEMSLVALALGIETAFVAMHHILRIVLIVVLAPLTFRLAGAGANALRRRGR